jgi:hypothetical protein
MQLDIYAGKKLFITLIQHYKRDGENGPLIINPGHFAAPGRKVVDEKQVRTWAKEWGYTVKNRYDTFDLVEEK